MSLLERIGDWFAHAAARPARQVLGESPLVLVDIDVTGVDIRQDRACGIALLPLFGTGFRMADIRYCPLPHGAAACHRELLARVGDVPVVSYNPNFVRFMLNCALQADGLPAVPWQWLDLEQLLEGAFGKEMGQVDSMQTWLARLGVACVREHSAVADVFAMAQMLEMIVARCEEAGIRTLEDLLQAQKDQSWLRGN